MSSLRLSCVAVVGVVLPGVVLPGVVVPGVMVPAVVVAGHVVWGATHHGEHVPAAGEDEGGDVEPGGVVPGDRLLTDLCSAVVRHQPEGTEDQLDDAPDELYSLWDNAVARSRAAIAEIAERGGLESAAAVSLPDGSPVIVRRMVMDLVEEYGRHTGHADILREAVDGRAGEDAPWPVSD